ncbi:Efflux transporter, RND family, MFP subunit [Chitinispirillum alkaliphilum]|nr:Efflux transporter, RND family, MFP subunit [Chitinispirillum alkaliphilum]
MVKKSVWLIVSGVVLIIVLLLLLGRDEPGRDSGAGWGRGPQGPVAVRVAEPENRHMQEIRQFTGTVRASYTYVVSAQAAGRLLSLDKRIGDRVGANEILGRIDETEYRHSLQEMEAQARVSRATLSESESQLLFTEREFERVKVLVEKGISSRMELETLQTQLESHRSRLELARAQLEQREASLAQARTRLGYTRIRSSKGGLVAKRHVDGGAQLTVGAPVVTIVGIDTVIVEIAVNERDYHRFEPGKAAVVSVDAIPGRTFEGVVHRVAPFFQKTSRTAVVEVAVVNVSQQIKPGMFARLSVTLSEKDSALVVPSSALVEKGQEYFMFVLTDSSTVNMVNVTAGIRDEQWTEIVSPENVDGAVVTLGQHMLRDGARVSVENKSLKKTLGKEQGLRADE